MRRRFSSAALPVHRHSLSQVALDAGLVALAYYLAYRLRFDGAGGVPELYHDLFVRTLGFVVIGNIAIFALFGLYRHWMRYSSQAEYLRIAQACLAAVLALVAYIAIVQPKLLFAPPRGFVSVNAPTGVLALYGLLMLVFLGGVRFVVHAIYERPLRGSRMRKDARSVLIVGAGDGGRLLLREIMRNPELGYRPVGFIDDDPRKEGARVDRGLEVLGTTDELGHVLDDVEPDEVLIAIPSAPGTMRAQGRRRVPRARRAGADDADRVRAAADRRPAHAAGARGQGRGHPGARAGADGGRARRRVPARAGRARHRRRRLDRLRAVPPDRARAAGAARAARPRRGQPVRDRARADRGPARAEHRLRPGGLQGGGADARGVRRAPADGRLPRRRLQARRADGEQPDRGGAQQLARHARDVPDRRRDGRARVHPRLDRQGGGARDGDGRLEGAGRVGGRGGRRALSRDALRQRAVRQRARLVGLGGADLPPPDRGGRAGHGHRPVDDALLHDDPGGGAARHPRGLAARTAARCSCSRWASRSGSSTWPRT